MFRAFNSYFNYQVILFDISNVPAILQDYINKILIKKLDIFVIIYLNNILIYINVGDFLEYIGEFSNS